MNETPDPLDELLAELENDVLTYIQGHPLFSRLSVEEIPECYEYLYESFMSMTKYAQQDIPLEDIGEAYVTYKGESNEPEEPK